MLIDKPYWINNKKEIEYFEIMSLQHLKNIIELFKRNYKAPNLHPTYNLALKIYNERLKLLPVPWILSNYPEPVGWIKEGKKYLKQKYHNLNIDCDSIIRNAIEQQFLMDTTIPIGMFKIKQIIW